MYILWFYINFQYEIRFFICGAELFIDEKVFAQFYGSFMFVRINDSEMKIHSPRDRTWEVEIYGHGTTINFSQVLQANDLLKKISSVL